MSELEQAKSKLADLRQKLSNGDSTIMPDELEAAQNEISRLEREKPEPSAGVGRMAAAYAKNDEMKGEARARKYHQENAPEIKPFKSRTDEPQPGTDRARRYYEQKSEDNNKNG